MKTFFEGKYFFFTKFCETDEEIKRTIVRCARSFKTNKYTVNKRITKVTDELGNLLYERKNRRVR